MRSFLIIYLLALFVTTPSAQADVVKPALIEISAYKTGEVRLEVRASLEALLSGISTQYKNTQSSPMADVYDAYRVLNSEVLQQQFTPFAPKFLSAMKLTVASPSEAMTIPLVIEKMDIPEAGYTKVPRISTVWLTGELPRDATSLSYYYPTHFGDYAVRLRQVDLAAEKWHWSEWEWVKTDRASKEFSLTEVFATKTTLQTIKEFIPIGFLHILPRGLDHILFILGLFLFSRKLSPLLWQITMFTLAHTVTLGLASAGYIELSPRIVEPLIALSIAYIGFENIFIRELHKHRLVLVFVFGLLHGLGFASVLSDFELPKDAFFTSLLSFNVGVELGQLAIIASAWFLLRWFWKSPNYFKLIVAPGSALIGITGLFWMIERLNII